MGEQMTLVGFKAGIKHVARLTSISVIVFAAAAAGPTVTDYGVFAFNTALAGNHGNNGNGKGSAPGQAKKTDNPDDGAADLADAIGGEAGSDPLPEDLLPIDAETAPANIEVIKEIAGLPDDSRLSEQEELEAIQSGWGTWRTADAPNTSAIQ